MFRPPFCPFSNCESQASLCVFSWKSRGKYFRKCDGRWVKRYSCKVCNRRFSTQSFKTDYRWKKPKLHFRVFDLFVSKVTMRQMARINNVRRPTIERRLRRLGLVCRKFHDIALANAELRGGIGGVFQLDELETYETDRRLSPVTMPVLIERHSYFVIHGETATMAARGNLTPRYREKKKRRDQSIGVRRSGSRTAVINSLNRLVSVHRPGVGITFESDRKSTYQKEFRNIAGPLFHRHRLVSSKKRRDKTNVLFPINHTLAMMRDSISRLVRRTWAASKLRGRLDLHFWIWACYRNYIRGITVLTRTTPAQALGVLPRAWNRVDLLRWRWPQIGLNWGQ
jgi:transposase-like protein